MTTSVPDVASADAPAVSKVNDAAVTQTMVDAIRDALLSHPNNALLGPDVRETLYAVARGHLLHGQAAQALPLFATLTICAPADPLYLLGHGVCLQQLARYTEAITSFSQATVVGDPTFEASLRTAQCLLAVGKVEDARSTLATLVQVVGVPGDAGVAGAANNTLIGQRAQALLDLIEQRLEVSAAASDTASQTNAASQSNETSVDGEASEVSVQ